MKPVIILAVASITMGASAQTPSKLSAASAAHIAQYKLSLEQNPQLNPLSATVEPDVTAIVTLEPGLSAADLAAMGYEVTLDLDDMAVISSNISRMEALAQSDMVKSVTLSRKKRLLMNKARSLSGVDAAHSGITDAGTTTAYKGNGVVIGMMDSGFDGTHINWLGYDGQSRLQRVWKYASSNGRATTYTPSNMSSFTTDDAEETHATHVAGMMTGAYNGSGSWAELNGTSVTTKTGSIPFYGVAPEAEMAISCGQLYDANILAGIQAVADYAAQQGKPAAINLSLGMNSGPHDGSDDFSRALDRVGQNAIVCVASGNEGDMDMSLQKTFTSTDTQVKTFVYYNNLYAYNIDGIIDIWGSDSRTFTVSLGAYKTSTKALTNLGSVSTSGGSVSISSSKTGIGSGSIAMQGYLDPNNNRFNVAIDCSTLKMTSGYMLSLTITGKSGQTVTAYFDGYSEFKDRGVSGYVSGSPDQSINGMACGDNIIAVGSWTTRNKVADLSGSAFGTNFAENDISDFSSYGTRFQGDRLPHVAAPGSSIISSFSRYFVAKGYSGESASDMCASAKSGSVTHYWGPMDGTSMATPFTTGVMALWLQADPTLNVADMKRVIANSSTTDTYTARSPEKFGAGKINAEAGLHYILAANSSIGSISPENNDPVILSHSAGVLRATVAGAPHFALTVCDMQGRTLARHTSNGPDTAIKTSHLGHGIYVATVEAPGISTSRKIML